MQEWLYIYLWVTLGDFFIMNNNCPNCLDHENRLKKLEKDMEEVKQDNKKQTVVVAIISLIGAVFTAIAGFAGVVFTAFMQSKGIL